ncbi:hypothetical protein GOP47_0012017 [Adiantum capillus-veneris]|uniref:Dirigent protein n=1 Tax=Adiantum capillus-veneris TaxID=13818 RepID=A0A9D4ZFY5_ADICA|nr:hypothetical protein GOP47_0012017 [Adiantum capillus-veneris]
MAQIHASVLAVSVLLLLPCLQAKDRPCSLSFHLLLQRPPLNLHNAPGKAPAQLQQPLTGPHLFAEEPLVQYSAIEGRVIGRNVVGSASGLYLADAADGKEVRYLYCTATLQNYKIAEEEGMVRGSVVLIGSVSGGVLSVVGGTGDFAFAVGQAKVSMAAASPSSVNSTLLVSLHLDLLYPEDPDLFSGIDSL